MTWPRQRKALQRQDGIDESEIKHRSPDFPFAVWLCNGNSFVQRLLASSRLRTGLFTIALYLMSFPPRGVQYPSLFYKHLVNPLIP